MDQAVGLGQEQVEVLEGEKEGAFIGGLDSGAEERPQRPHSDANPQTLPQPWQKELLVLISEDGPTPIYRPWRHLQTELRDSCSGPGGGENWSSRRLNTAPGTERPRLEVGEQRRDRVNGLSSHGLRFYINIENGLRS